jgi:branched-chain amino acid transport system substrate-binding protein
MCDQKIGERSVKTKWLLTAALLPLLPICAMAAESVKIGLITTLSGPEAVMGNPMRDSANLALSMLGGKIGGLPAEIIFGDDQQKPDLGRQQAEKMLKKDKVDFITGMLGSNVLLAVYQQVVSSHTILISANSGPHQLAAGMCSPYFFAMASQNDEAPEAMGYYLTERHVDDVYVMAPNYAAGHDMISGFKRSYKGKIAGEVYTTFGQLDYQAELNQIRDAKPKAVFVFYPGGMGIQFVKQYAESGLKNEIPLYSAYTVDSSTLQAVREAALGNYEASFWGADLDIPRSKEYVAAFSKEYGYTPPNYGAVSFDAIFAIDSAVKAVHGDLSNRQGMIDALEQASFPSVRGQFAFNANHFPIENFYLFQVQKTEDGKEFLKEQETIFTAHKDAYAPECHMKKE